MGNRGIMSFISGEHKSKNEGNRGTNVIVGSREQKIKILILRTVSRENAEIFQGRGIPHTHTHTHTHIHTHWEGFTRSVFIGYGCH